MGSCEFIYGNQSTQEVIRWPKGFSQHYIEKFNVQPSEEFYNFVMNFSGSEEQVRSQKLDNQVMHSEAREWRKALVDAFSNPDNIKFDPIGEDINFLEDAICGECKKIGGGVIPYSKHIFSKIKNCSNEVINDNDINSFIKVVEEYNEFTSVQWTKIRDVVNNSCFTEKEKDFFSFIYVVYGRPEHNDTCPACGLCSLGNSCEDRQKAIDDPKNQKELLKEFYNGLALFAAIG